MLFGGARKVDAQEADAGAEYEQRIQDGADRLAGGRRPASSCSSPPNGATCRSCSPRAWSPRAARRSPVFVGSWVGLVAGRRRGVLLGRVLLRHVRLSLVRYVGAAVCAVLAVVTVVAALQSASDRQVRRLRLGVALASGRAAT